MKRLGHDFLPGLHAGRGNKRRKYSEFPCLVPPLSEISSGVVQMATDEAPDGAIFQPE